MLYTKKSWEVYKYIGTWDYICSTFFLFFVCPCCICIYLFSPKYHFPHVGSSNRVMFMKHNPMIIPNSPYIK